MSNSFKNKIDIEVNKAMNSDKGGRSVKAKVANASALMLLGVLPLVSDDSKAARLLKLISQLTKGKLLASAFQSGTEVLYIPVFKGKIQS